MLNKAFTFQLAKARFQKKLLQNFKKKYQDYEISGQIFLRYMRIKTLMIHQLYPHFNRYRNCIDL